jgi:hypothetical protein
MSKDPADAASEDVVTAKLALCVRRIVFADLEVVEPSGIEPLT